MTISRHERFVLAVQTMAIVRDINTDREIAAYVVLEAAALDDLMPPDEIDIDAAVKQFVDYAYGVVTTRPEWLAS